MKTVMDQLSTIHFGILSKPRRTHYNPRRLWNIDVNR